MNFQAITQARQTPFRHMLSHHEKDEENEGLQTLSSESIAIVFTASKIRENDPAKIRALLPKSLASPIYRSSPILMSDTPTRNLFCHSV